MCVVGEKLIVVTAIALQGIDHKKARVALARENALLHYGFGKRGGGGRDVVLGGDGIDVGRGAYVEDDLHSHSAVVGAGGLHIEHIARAHNLLGDGDGNGVIHSDGIGADVRGRDLHDGRGDVGVLLDGKA